MQGSTFSHESHDGFEGFAPKVRYGLNAVVRQAHHERMMIRNPLILSLSKDYFLRYLHSYVSYIRSR